MWRKGDSANGTALNGQGLPYEADMQQTLNPASFTRDDMASVTYRLAVPDATNAAQWEQICEAYRAAPTSEYFNKPGEDLDWDDIRPMKEALTI